MSNADDEGRMVAWPWTVTTVVYLIGVGVYVVIARQAVMGLAPNNVGDLLAGIFAPLAFLWLVFGFYAQRRELALQRRTLAAQLEQLALQRIEVRENTQAQVNQEAQLKRAADLKEKELEQAHERERLAREPVFEFDQWIGVDGVTCLLFLNRGARANELLVLVNELPDLSAAKSVATGERVRVTTKIPITQPPGVVRTHFRFRRVDGTSGSQQFEIAQASPLHGK